MKKIHRASRWIWFFNGIFILILALIFIYYFIDDQFGEPKSMWDNDYEKGPIVGDRLEKARLDSLALQDIIVSLPLEIVNSEYCYMRISSEDLEEPLSYRKTGFCMNMEPPSYSIYDDLLNVLFFRESDYSDAHLLLSEKANIVMMDVPQSSDSIRDFILYAIANEDTNEDGRINASDHTDLFISDTAGNNFHKITDEKVYLVDYLIDLSDYEILLKVQEKSSGEIAPDEPRIEKLLVYDLSEKKLYQPLDIQKFVSEARGYLWR